MMSRIKTGSVSKDIHTHTYCTVTHTHTVTVTHPHAHTLHTHSHTDKYPDSITRFREQFLCSGQFPCGPGVRTRAPPSTERWGPG